ncbi:MAG: nickel-responsive transcriptional regulator NikR [Verrucomicrobia bacterium]|nr:nickel-responsive transcriptional regulator NikR [Verrucomicrobiota bacterium]MCH8514204.1 nickel-responsive transcriptional regulator NikR [Kiritimatiellia bacterium]
MSEELRRITVSIPAENLEGLDRLSEGRGFPNRSQALSALIGEAVIAYEAETCETVMMGVLTFIYEHRRRNLQNRITDVQHQFLKEIITIQLVHLEKDQSLQILLVQGPSGTLREIRDAFAALKGVRHAALQVSSTLLPPLHDHTETP